MDGIDVAYEEFGHGRPNLFLRGWVLDHACEVADFEPIFANRLGWRRLYLNLPGQRFAVAVPRRPARCDRRL